MGGILPTRTMYLHGTVPVRETSVTERKKILEAPNEAKYVRYYASYACAPFHLKIYCLFECFFVKVSLLWIDPTGTVHYDIHYVLCIFLVC